MLDFDTVKLGARPPKYDPRTLKLSRYFSLSQLPSPPATIDWGSAVPDGHWGAMNNDRYGCCTCSACGHSIQSWTAQVGGADAEITVADADVLAMYSVISGFNPVTGANDNGALALDALNYWRQTGLGGHHLFAYAKAETGNLDHVRAAVSLFGNCYIAVGLPNSAKSQQIWDVPPQGPTGDGSPWSWGGHAINIVEYDEVGPQIATWGYKQKLTWRFLQTYCSEAFAILGPEWVNGASMAPSGFDWEALQNDLSLIPGMDPIPVPKPQPPVDPAADYDNWVIPAATWMIDQHKQGNHENAQNEARLIGRTSLAWAGQE